jgi:hypothetical protein
MHTADPDARGTFALIMGTRAASVHFQTDPMPVFFAPLAAQITGRSSTEAVGFVVSAARQRSGKPGDDPSERVKDEKAGVGLPRAQRERENVTLDVDESKLVHERDGLSAAVDVELCQDALDVAADRLRTDEELRRDLRLPQPAREEPQNFALAGRQGPADRRDVLDSSR